MFKTMSKKEIKMDIDNWFKGEINEKNSDSIYEQLVKNVAKMQDVDIAMTPLIDLLTGYVRYRELEKIINAALEYIEDNLFPIGNEVNGSDLPYDEAIQPLINILKGKRCE